MHRNLKSLALFLTATLSQGQTTYTTELQSAGFNSSFTLSQAQIEAASLSTASVTDVENTSRFDRSQLANGGPAEDDFYTLPVLTNMSALEPGVLLKVQDFTNTSSFTLPPNTALSRILYTTTNLNGTVLPASAFILWPFQPRQFKSSSTAAVAAPVVLWSHGTSGFFASQAPSSHRALWYAHAGPFALAQAGYAVVAADYGGLGISVSWDGSEIPHQYLASRVSARDGLYALRAAWAAFPDLLTKEFVSVGHSQGGGVSWGVAEVLAEDEEGALADLAVGYLGAISGSPTTDLYTGVPQFIVPWVSMFLGGIFPTFDPAEWLTPLGLARVNLLREIEGGISVSQQLFLNTSGTDGEVFKNSYRSTWYADAYGKLANVGSRPFVGPLLVIQGTADIYNRYVVTTKTVDNTCAYLQSRNLGGDLEYVVVNGTYHVPTMDATRPLWLQWIQDRFEGKSVERTGCVTTNLESFMPIERYQATGNSYLQWAGASEYSFEIPLGL